MKTRPASSRTLKMTSQKVSCSILLAALALPSVANAQKNWFFDLDMTLQSDSNINQAKLDSQKVEDTVTSAQLSSGYQMDIDAMSALTLKAGLSAKQFKELRAQNSKSAHLGGSFLWQNSVGYRSPLYQLSFDSEFQNNDSKQQDSTILNAQFIVSMRVTDIVSATFGLGAKDRDSESTVYDLSDQRVFISGDYALNKKASLYATFSYITGDTFSVSIPGNSYDLLLIALDVGADNSQWDEAYNESLGGAGTWQSYRTEADSLVYILGFNYGVGHSSSLDLSYTYADVSGDAGAEYQRGIISGSLLRRF